jgi:hypothetical protein
MKPTLKVPGTKRLKLICDEPLSNFAFDFHLCRYTKETELGEMQLRLLENMVRAGIIHFAPRWSSFVASRDSLWPFHSKHTSV